MPGFALAGFKLDPAIIGGAIGAGYVAFLHMILMRRPPQAVQRVTLGPNPTGPRGRLIIGLGLATSGHRGEMLLESANGAILEIAPSPRRSDPSRGGGTNRFR